MFDQCCSDICDCCHWFCCFCCFRCWRRCYYHPHWFLSEVSRSIADSSIPRRVRCLLQAHHPMMISLMLTSLLLSTSYVHDDNDNLVDLEYISHSSICTCEALRKFPETYLCTSRSSVTHKLYSVQSDVFAVLAVKMISVLYASLRLHISRLVLAFCGYHHCCYKPCQRTSML